MKVNMQAELFSPAVLRRHPFLLHGLFEACLRREHEVVLAFDVEQSGPFETWKAELSLDQLELVELVLRSSAQLEARETTDCEIVATAQGTDWTAAPPKIGPSEIVPLLDAPLMILVENEVNDGAFLKAVGFGFDRRTFLSCLHEGRIRFENAGGSEMKNILVARGGDHRRAHRMWCIFDGDALLPAQPSRESGEKIAACKAGQIRHHMLQRRAIENYLPPDELDQSIPHSPKTLAARRAASAFKRLSPEQRAHYNLKGGFDGDAARLAPGGKDVGREPAVRALFAGVKQADRDALAVGFGKDIASLFAPDPARGRPGFSEAARRRDGQEAEMVPLFRAILRWL